MTLDLSKYLAKPNETIEQHNNELLKCKNVLKSFGYLKDNEIEKLLEVSIKSHDLGKVNPEFQKRVQSHYKFNEENEIVHNILSIFLMNKKLFLENGLTEEDYYRCLHIVLNHHDYGNPYLIMKEKDCLIKKLLSEFDIERITEGTKRRIKNYISDDKTILTKGLLHKCDYAASAHLPVEYENNFLKESLTEFKNNNNIKWNPLQEFCMNNSEENILTIAQTGMGKTEASLLWNGNNKSFFFLPLQTTNNAIYDRIKSMVKTDIDNRVGLLHSNNLLEYTNEENSDVIEHYKLSKQFSLPVNVSTIDQLFDFVFKYKGYELKLSTLSYSKVIVDEIQMYDAKLLAYLIYGLEELNKFGTKICITTATLAPFIKDLLTENIEFKMGTFTNDLIRHNLKIYKSELTEDYILEHYNMHKNDKSNKTLIVVNTVKKAQELYEKLIENGVKNVNLLHSKFNKNDRLKKEKEIIEDGKTENKKHCIWISTQIVEASLDIDFDYLFTELSDLSGLLQRLGRCNRKGTKDISKYNCFVFTDIDKKIIGKVVDETIYNLSKNAILKIDGKFSEEDKLNLIDETLTTDNLKDSDYFKLLKRTYNYVKKITDYSFDKSDVDLREIISYNIIPLSVYEENEEEINEILEKLNNSKLDMLLKIEFENKLKNMSVSISHIYIKKIMNNLIKEIKINKYNRIFVIDCLYDKNEGFRWKNEENNELFL